MGSVIYTGFMVDDSCLLSMSPCRLIVLDGGGETQRHSQAISNVCLINEKKKRPYVCTPGSGLMFYRPSAQLHAPLHELNLPFFVVWTLTFTKLPSNMKDQVSASEALWKV